MSEDIEPSAICLRCGGLGHFPEPCKDEVEIDFEAHLRKANPTPPPASADLEALNPTMMSALDALAEGPLPGYNIARFAAKTLREYAAHVASLTARLAAAEAETERFQQAALRGIDLAEAYGADRQKAYDKIFQPQRGTP